MARNRDSQVPQEGSFQRLFGTSVQAHLQAGKEARYDPGLCQAACHKGHRAQHSGALRLPSALQLPHQALRACLHTLIITSCAFVCDKCIARHKGLWKAADASHMPVCAPPSSCADLAVVSDQDMI